MVRYHGSLFRRYNNHSAPSSDDGSTLLRLPRKGSTSTAVSWQNFVSLSKPQPHDASPPAPPIRLTTSKSQPQAPASCYICMESFHPSDVAHPILCPSTQCSFSFCCHCIETMTTTHHHDPTRNLPCPNCRSPLQTTLYDTLLLRKVDRVEDPTTTPRTSRHDPQTNPPNVRSSSTSTNEWKKAMHVDVAVLKEIADARDREARAWKRKTAAASSELQTSSEPRDDVEDDCRDDGGDANKRDNSLLSPVASPEDEWGFEVDVRIGPHASIKLPHAVTMMAHADHSSLTPFVDKTLLAGLDSAMTRTEQVRISRWLTSGDPHALLRAAQAMAVVIHRVYTKHQSSAASSNSSASTQTTTSTGLEPSLSIYEVIHASRTARRKGRLISNGRDPVPSSNSRCKHRQSKKQPYGSTIQQFRRQQTYLRHYPLPSRMPKSVRLPRDTSSAGMSLALDTWDGTLVDVFRSPAPSWVLPGRLDTPTLRWIVARAPPGQRHGIVPGDVVTHVNGVEVVARAGQAWEEVVQACSTRSHGGYSPTDEDDDEEDDTVEWVFNADRSVSEALKQRAAASRHA